DAELVLILPRFRFNCDTDHRRRKLHRFEHDRLVVVANRVAGGHLLHAADGDDLARTRGFNVLTLVRVHAHQAPDTFFRILDRVVSIRAGFDRAAVNTHERKLTEVLVGHDLEDQTGKRSTRIGRTRLRLTGLRVHAFNGRNIEWRR